VAGSTVKLAWAATAEMAENAARRIDWRMMAADCGVTAMGA